MILYERIIPMVMVHRPEQEKSDLIARYIEPDPHRPGRYNARLIPSGVAVWAIVGRFEIVNHGDLAAAAADYDIPYEAVEAALAYYERNRAAIDARLEALRAHFTA